VKALKDAGAKVEIISPEGKRFQGYKGHEKGDMISVDCQLDGARPSDYEAAAVEFVRHFVREKKPIAAICHGPWTLINADGVRGRRMTSWPSLEMDLRNAGAEWVDEAVVTDEGLVTSRKPADLPQFCRKMIEEFGEGRHERRQAGMAR
jgi:protease I